MTGEPADFCPRCGSGLADREHDGRVRRYCADCAEFVWTNPVPVAIVAVFDGEDALFVERSVSPHEGEWDLPGGFVEADEGPAAGAARELAEETGVRVDPDDLDLCGVGHERRDGRSLVPVVYAVDRADTAGEVRAGSDADAARFTTPARLHEAGEEVREAAVERYRLCR